MGCSLRRDVSLVEPSPLRSRADLIRHIGQIIEDVKHDTTTMTNDRTEDFLEALQAWFEDSDRGEQEAPTWALIGAAIDAALIYE